MINKNAYNSAYSGQWLVGSLLRFVRYAHYTTQATHQPPPHMRFRYAQAKDKKLRVEIILIVP